MAVNYNTFFSSTLGNNTTANPQYTIARVTKVVMGPYLDDGKTIDPDYQGIADIGKISYVILNSYQTHEGMADANRPARPFFSYITQYPLRDEYVLIVPGPGLNLNNAAGDIDYYYIGPIQLWGSCHHNSFPDLRIYSAYVNADEVDYQQTTLGSSNKTANTTMMEFPLGGDFPERSDLKNLIPFRGDVLIEGRYGNSIRFGSTVPTFQKFNKWSGGDLAEERNGDPITIIRNGQGSQDNKLGYVPTVEDLDIDQSSIYLTAGQVIDIADLSNFPLTSWNVTINTKTVNTITLTTPPTSNDNYSAREQDLADNRPITVQQTQPSGPS